MPITARGKASLTLLVGLLGGCSCGDDDARELGPSLATSVNAVDLGGVYVGAAAEQVVEVRSVGTAQLEVRSTLMDGPPSLALVAPFEGTLEPGTAAVLTVRFTPTAAGAVEGRLLITHDTEPPASVTVRGTGLAPLSCDDDNDCTVDSFDAPSGECRRSFRGGSCDDASACTENDTCLDGACLGSPVVCEEPADGCSSVLCSAELGCAAIPDDAACADDNPCTRDRCVVDEGCVNEALPDVPCDDGDFCTIADVCEEGQCVGARIERDLATLGTVFTFGSSSSTPLPDERILFVDGRGTGGNGATATVGSVSPSGLSVVAMTRIPNIDPLSALAALDGDLVGGVNQSVFTALQVGPDGVVTARGSVTMTVESWAASFQPYVVDAAAAGTTWYGCGTNADFAEVLLVVDVSDADAPVVAATVPSQWCEGLAVDESGARLLVVAAGEVRSYSLVDPLQPVLESNAFYSEDSWAQTIDVNAGHAVMALTDGPDLLNARVAVARLSDGEIVREIPGASSPVVGSGWLVAHSLSSPTSAALGGERELVRLSLSSPTGELEHARAPPQLLEAEHSLDLRGGFVTEESIVIGGHVVTNDFSAPSLRWLTHPQHGEVGRVHVVNGAVLLVSHVSARRLEVVVPDAPAFVAGGALPVSAAIASFGAQGSAPTVTSDRVSPFSPIQEWSMTDALQVDVSDLGVARPVAVRASETGVVSDVAAAAARGDRLYVVAKHGGGMPSIPCGNADGPDVPAWWLFVFDVGSAPSSPDEPLTLQACLALPFGTAPFPATLDGQPLVQLDPNGSRVVAAIAIYFNGGQSTLFALVDVDEGIALIASGTWPASGPWPDTASFNDKARGIATAKGRVAALLGRSPYSKLVLFDVVAGTLTPGTPLDAPAHNILHFDGRHVVLGGRVSFYDASTDPPAFIAETVLAEPAQSAAVVGEHLVVSGPNSASVLAPACVAP